MKHALMLKENTPYSFVRGRHFISCLDFEQSFHHYHHHHRCHQHQYPHNHYHHHHQLFHHHLHVTVFHPQPVIDGLKAKGHKFKDITSFAVVQALHILQNSSVVAVSDYRKGGKPAGF